MDKQRINYLLQKYLDRSINDTEKQELFNLYRKIGSQYAEYPDDRESVSERILLRLTEEIKHEEKRVSFFKSWKMIAAAVILVATSIYLVNRPWGSPKEIVQKNPKKQIILPGANVATLTLGNGKKILLNSANQGKIAVQGNTVITKNASGQISYQVANDNPPANDQQIVYNTITTPKGGQFKITLLDGSNVWLNAASSLTYPSTFKGNERHVELHGEAYFEIFKNKNLPFTVTAENINIKVLGTHFNVMAYENEPSVNTTLLEGSVSLTSKNITTTMVPGQQAIGAKNRNEITLHFVNVEDAVAWKNGYFSFRKENIQTVMNKIARWYNVDIEYRGNISDKIMGGTVSRAENIAELLNYLELTGIAKFQIEGRRIIVICK